MSIPKYYVLDIAEQLRMVQSTGFSYLDRYKKAEILVGDSKSVDMVQQYFSKEGKFMINHLRESNKLDVFLEMLINDVHNHTYFADAFVKNYNLLND